MKKLIILLSIFFRIFSANAQNDFYFDKWKAKGEIVAQGVLIIMDSTNSDKGKEFNERLGNLISKNLQEMGIKSNSTFDYKTTDSNILIIKFHMLKPAYVKLNTFGAEIPLCNRFEINQINKIPGKKNRNIKTTLAISVDKEETGLTQASNALASLIFESIRK